VPLLRSSSSKLAFLTVAMIPAMGCLDALIGVYFFRLAVYPLLAFHSVLLVLALVELSDVSSVSYSRYIE